MGPPGCSPACWSPFSHLTEGVPSAASSCVENGDEVLKVHQNPLLFSPFFFFSRNICFKNVINKTEYTLFSTHMEHSLKEMIFLGHKASLNKFQRTKMIQSIFSSHSRVKPEIGKKITTKTFSKCLKNQATHI